MDTSFLGNDILNDPPSDDFEGPPTDAHVLAPPPVAGVGDALILGDPSTDVDSFLSDKTGEFLSCMTGEVQRYIHPANVYVDADTKAMLAPDAVLQKTDRFDPDTLVLSPFEQHVLAHIDGERPTARVRKVAGLSRDDLNIALAMLADRGVIELVGHARPSPSKRDPMDPPTDETRLPAALESDIDADELQELLADSGWSDDSPDDDPNPFATAPPMAAVPPLPGSTGVRARSIPPLPAMPEPPKAAPPKTTPPVPPSPAATTPAARAPASARKPASSPLPPPRAKSPPATVSKALQVKADNLYKRALRDIRDGRLARAKMFATTARDLNPEDPRYAYLLDHWSEARKIADASEIAPEDVRLFMKAQQAEKAGEYAEAIALLKQALKLKPDAAQINNQLGVVMALRLQDYTAAMSYLFRAVELEPKNTAYKNNLGKVLALASGGSAERAARLLDENTGQSATKSRGLFGSLKKKLF